MDADLRQRMLAYYDERAPEYEEAYTLGTGTASIADPEVFKAEARVLSGIVGQVAHGRIMDLACGTAYWLPDYASNCSHITLFDQSARMLTESRAKAHRLGVLDRCALIQGDVFGEEFEPNLYDTVAGRLLVEPPHRRSGASPVRCGSGHACPFRPISASRFSVESGTGEIQRQGRAAAEAIERRNGVRDLQKVL